MGQRVCLVRHQGGQTQVEQAGEQTVRPPERWFSFAGVPLALPVLI